MKQSHKMGFSILFFVLFIMAFFVIIETVSLGVLKAKNIPRKAFLINRLPAFGFAEVVTYPHLDPLLGHAANTPFTEYGSQDSKQSIAILGGSTVAHFSDKSNWPELFSKNLAREGRQVRVLNGGVGGYSSNQEVLKTVRDIAPLKPTILITFDGINDFGNHSVEKYVMTHPYQLALYSTLLSPTALFFPNTVHLAHKITDVLFKKHTLDLRMGVEHIDSLPQNWVRNQRMIHAVATELGIHHLSYLQPTNGVGKYTPTKEELDTLRSIVFKEDAPDYTKAANAFYDEARPLCNSLSYCTDLTDVFDGKTALYADPRHPNQEGYQIIADTILKDLKKKKLIN